MARPRIDDYEIGFPIATPLRQQSKVIKLTIFVISISLFMKKYTFFYLMAT